MSQNGRSHSHQSTRESTTQSEGGNHENVSATHSSNHPQRSSVNDPFIHDPTLLPDISTALRRLEEAGSPGLSHSGNVTLAPITNHNYDNSGNFVGPSHNNSSIGPSPVEPQTATSADALYFDPRHYNAPFSGETIFRNFQGFTKTDNSTNAMYPDELYDRYNLNQVKPGAVVTPQRSFNFDNPLASDRSPLPHGALGTLYYQHPSFVPPSPLLPFPRPAANDAAVAPAQAAHHPEEQEPAPVAAAAEFVRPEYVDLEINRIAQPGPVPHPDKNFRPYGVNNWHMILHDHTLLRFLVQTEIRQIRDHVGRLSEHERVYEIIEKNDAKRAGVEYNPERPRLLNDGPYNVDDLTQVWTYCQQYLDRRAQLRNNNAARRSRMKKDAEIYHWKILAVSAGIEDHEYEFTEEEEMAAIARADAAKEEADAAADEKRKNKKRFYGDPPARPRGRKAAKKTANATAGASSMNAAAGPSGSSPVASLGQNMPGAGHQIPQYQGYAPAPAPAHQQQQSSYGPYQQNSPAQAHGQQLQHRFNTRSRARAAEQDASVSPFGYAGEYETFDTPTSTAP